MPQLLRNIRHQIGWLYVECMGEADYGVEARGLVAIFNDRNVIPAATSEFGKSFLREASFEP